MSTSEDTNRAIVFIGGSKSTYPFLERAKERRLHTIVFDRDSNAFCRWHCDEFYAVSTHNDSEILSIVKEHEGTGVGLLCYSSYPGALKTNAIVAKALGVNGFETHAVETCYNKELLKNKLLMAGVSCPKSVTVKGKESSLNDSIQAIGLPCIVKPVNGIGSSGITILREEEDCKDSIEVMNERGEDVLVEQYVEGDFIHVDGFVCNGIVSILSYSKKMVEYINGIPLTAGYQIIDGEKDVNEKFAEQIKNFIHRGIAEIGIDNQFFGADIIITNDGKMYFLEMGLLLDAKMDRLLFHAGIDVYSLLINIVLDETEAIEHAALSSKGWALRFLYSKKKGALHHNPQSSNDVIIEWEREEMSKVRPPTAISDILGWIVCRGETSADAWNTCLTYSDSNLFTIQ